MSLRKKIRKVEKKMRNITTKLTILAFALAAFGAEAKFNHSHELYNSFSFSTPAGEDSKKTNYGATLINTVSYRSSENWTHAAILSTGFSVISAGESNFDQNHKYIRIQSIRSNFTVLDGWKSKLRFRWQPLTGNAAVQGGFGTLNNRLSFSRSFGDLSLSWNNIIQIGLVDSGYQKFTSPGGTQSGNTLVTWGIELTPSYSFSDDWTPYWYNGFYQSYKGGAPGAEGAMGDISWDWEIGVGLPLGLPVSIGVYTGYGTTFNDSFKFYDVEGAYYGMVLSRAF